MKIQHFFTNGRMDSDKSKSFFDENSYSYALNLRPSGYGEDGEMNAIKGSELLADHSENGTMTVVGMFAGQNNKMYVFMARKDGLSKIIQIDIESRDSKLIIEDAEFLRFDLLRWNDCLEIRKEYLLSINQIDDFLYFSHPVWERPRKINVNKTYTDFSLEDIILSKKPPKFAPYIYAGKAALKKNKKFNKFVSFAYRYKYEDGTWSVLSFYTKHSFFADSLFNVLHDEENKNESMQNSYESVDIQIDTGDSSVVAIEVIAREHKSNTAYSIFYGEKGKSKIKGKVITDNTQINIPYSYSKSYTIFDETLTDLIYSNIPKYPKTQEAVGNRLLYGNYKEGYDMTDKDGNDVQIDIDYELRQHQFPKGKTLASGIKYKLGVVYYNDFNECSSVLINADDSKNEIDIPLITSDVSNFIRARIHHKPPHWATKFKFVINHEKLNYDYVYIDFAKKVGEYAYLHLKGIEKDKVKEGDTINLISPFGNYDDNQFIIDEIKTHDDGKLYAKIKYKSYLNIPDNPTVIKQDGNNGWDVPHRIIDVMFNRAPNINAFVGVSGYQGSNNNILIFNTWTSQSNRLTIPKNNNTFTSFNKHDVFNIEIRFRYYLYPMAQNNDGMWLIHDRLGEHMGDIVMNTKLRADEDNMSLWDLFFNKNKNTSLKIGQTTNDFHILTDFDYQFHARKLKYYDAFQKHKAIGVEVYPVLTVVKDGREFLFRTENKETHNNTYYEDTETFLIENGEHMGANELGYWNTNLHNAISLEGGYESYKVNDELNGNALDYGYRLNMVEPNGYGVKHRKTDISFSGKYNRDLKINNLNIFNPSIANWKELPHEYGEIQRMISTDGDLTVFTEDKVINQLYGKSIISELQGSDNLVSIKETLGDHIILPYTFGCQNPESITKSAEGIFFIDKKRKRYLFKSDRQILELNMEGTGHHRRGVNEINEHSYFISYYDYGFGEWVCGLDNNNMIVFNPQAKGFSHYYNYHFEYIFSMNGKRYTALNGRIYEDEISETLYNTFAEGQSKESIITFSVSNDLNKDKIFKAIQVHSNIAWDTYVKTNLTKSFFDASKYYKKESFFYSHIYRNNIRYKNVKGIGVISAHSVGSTTAALHLTRPIGVEIAVGDTIRNESGTAEADIININRNTLTINKSEFVNFNINDYIYAMKQSDIQYVPDGGSIRGNWLEVTLTANSTSKFGITSVSIEAIESKL